MNLTSLIIAVIVIVLAFLFLRFVMKALKRAVALIVIIVVLGVWFYGFSGVFDKVSDVKDLMPELGIQKIARSVNGCTTEQDCAYVVNAGDCRQAAGYCNNILEFDNYKKVSGEEILNEECNRTSVELNYTIDCECKLHKQRENKIKQWVNDMFEKKAGYTYCWVKSP
ncbi:hypothetical protein FJZ53_05420 [Candidatus Woesearchaeota archaeon]|nr:hypothetical protein [Candidatus Woesearchaeota archaeon]